MRAFAMGATIDPQDAPPSAYGMERLTVGAKLSYAFEIVFETRASGVLRLRVPPRRKEW
jgi:hypothetical protein